MKRSPLKRKTRLKPRKEHRPVEVGKLGIVRLHGDAMTDLRWKVFLRDQGVCQMQLDSDCWHYAEFKHGHLAHIRTKRNNGDTMENTAWACPSCHGKSHNCGGKPVPPKPKQEEIDGEVNQ